MVKHKENTSPFRNPTPSRPTHQNPAELTPINHEAAATAKKKKNKLGPNAVAMKHQVPLKPNPFETVWFQKKFDIPGKKRKGEKRRVGLSRSRAIEKRKNTLLKEYEQSNKASVFVDKQIGEHNDELNEFDKAIRHAQREHQLLVRYASMVKKSKYNLSDGEEDDFEFQGLGALSERDDFEDDVLPADDNDGTETTQTKRQKTTNEGRDCQESKTQIGEDKQWRSNQGCRSLINGEARNYN